MDDGIPIRNRHEEPQDRPDPLYLDYHPGIDDTLALAYLLVSPNVELVGTGTVSGNTSSVIQKMFVSHVGFSTDAGAATRWHRGRLGLASVAHLCSAHTISKPLSLSRHERVTLP